jgi:hypothetical protein
MIKIASMTPPVPRGKIIGKPVGGPPLSETGHFWKCEACAAFCGKCLRRLFCIRWQHLFRQKRCFGETLGSSCAYADGGMIGG